MGETEQVAGASCASCVFPLWIQQQQTKAGVISQGYCRRNPPVPLLKTQMVESKIAGASPTIQHVIEPAFPGTQSTGWCGEHLTPDEYLALRAGDDAEQVSNDAA